MRLRMPLAMIPIAIALGGSLCRCSYDVVFSRSSSATDSQAGAAGQGNASMPSGGGGSASTTSNTTAGVSAIPSFPPGISWQWQLVGAIDLAVAADLYTVDLTDVTDREIAALRGSARRIICNFSAGTSEPWRMDIAALPPEVLGNVISGRTNETWLDVRASSVRELMAARLDLAKARGCTGVLAECIDGYAADTGFPIGSAESLDYLSFLSNEAHRRGLGIGLSNASELAAVAQPWFEFVIEVSCLEYEECNAYRAFLDAYKPVLHAEIVSDAAIGAQRLDTICGDTSRVGFSTILKLSSLDAWRMACE